MTRRLRPLPLLAALLLVAACGDSDEPSADEKAVTDTARSVITDAKKACDLLTPTALESTYRTGKDPLATCRRTVKPESVPSSAELAVVSLDPSRASVGYRTNAGVIGVMELVKQGGGWRMERAATLPAAR